ncbi:uncharacterized protein LOC129903717 [Solanum dulcamara]|uniref:uncharacterized protein LOC129903717 n=1 Tax=Solanum dulcamara TaxID=45834 RepID=UPI002485ED08|nr:uncharacterized protein LOC129903717 [Solanum dulcamara]
MAAMEPDPPPDLQKFPSKDGVVDIDETNPTQKESETSNLQHIRNSSDFTVAIERNEAATVQGNSGESPANRTAIWTSYGDIRDGAPPGFCNPPRGAPHTKSPTPLDDGGAGNTLSNSDVGVPATFELPDQCHLVEELNTSTIIQKSPPSSKSNLSNINSNNSGGEAISGSGGAAASDGENSKLSVGFVDDHTRNTINQKAPSSTTPNTLNLEIRVAPPPAGGGAAAEPQTQNWQCQTAQHNEGSPPMQKAPSGMPHFNSNLTFRVSNLSSTDTSGSAGSPATGKNIFELNFNPQHQTNPQEQIFSKKDPSNNSNVDSSLDPKEKTTGTIFPVNAQNKSQSKSNPHTLRNEINQTTQFLGTSNSNSKIPTCVTRGENSLIVPEAVLVDRITTLGNPSTSTNPKHTNHPPVSDFPPISSNFQKFDPKNSKNPIVSFTPSALPPKTKSPNNQPTTTNHPPPPIAKQSMATRLRAKQAEHTTRIDLTPPKRVTKQGCPAIMFKREDYMVKMAESCKYTLIGKFYSPMPKMEVIRKKFISQTELRGKVKITHFNSRHIYIDLDNEHDRTTVLDSKRMYIDGVFMRFQVWTPTFDPNYETPILPVWVILPELPWHCFHKEFVTLLLADVGQVLHLDMAFMQKTRGSVAKAKVQMDITKPRIQSVWIGFDENDDPNGEGRWQDIEYEDVPLYCTYCKHQGHTPLACPVSRRDTECNKAKDKEEEPKKDASPKITGMISTPIVLTNAISFRQQVPLEETTTTNQEGSRKAQEDSTNQNRNQISNNQWETQKRRNFKGKTQTVQNTQTIQGNTQQHEHQPGIDSMLPIPHGSPSSFNVLNVLTAAAEVVNGGEDGGIQEKPTNLQEGVSRGGVVSHVLHENLMVDPRNDFRAPATTSHIQHSSSQHVNKRDSVDAQKMASKLPPAVTIGCETTVDFGRLSSPSLRTEQQQFRSVDVGANQSQKMTQQVAQNLQVLGGSATVGLREAIHVLDATSAATMEENRVHNRAIQMQKQRPADAPIPTKKMTNTATPYQPQNSQENRVHNKATQMQGSRPAAAGLEQNLHGFGPISASTLKEKSVQVVAPKLISIQHNSQGVDHTENVENDQHYGCSFSITSSDQTSSLSSHQVQHSNSKQKDNATISGIEFSASPSPYNQQATSKTLRKKRTRKKKQEKKQEAATPTPPTTADTGGKDNNGEVFSNSCSQYVLLDQSTPIRSPDFSCEDPLNLTPLNIQPAPFTQPENATNILCTNNDAQTSTPDSDDEYGVIHSEDEYDQDFQGEVELENEEETDEQSNSIAAPSKTTTKVTNDEMNQLANKQGLSPRGMVRMRGTTGHDDIPCPGRPRGQPRGISTGATPAPDLDIVPEHVEEYQDTPIPPQPEGPPPVS